MALADSDMAVRSEALAHIEVLKGLYGDAIPRQILVQGFMFQGLRVPLVGPPGIFKPAVLSDMPLTITTAPPAEGQARPYEDELRDDGLFEYKYRGTDPNNYDNVWLRRAMETGTPLIYFIGIVKGQYMAVSPAFVVAEERARLAFVVAADEAYALQVVADSEIERSVRRTYATALTRRRLHQAEFRSKVMSAYRQACAMCRLRHPELLDAAHILPDGHPKGDPVVPNGIALCKIHHAAFDQNVLGVQPDLVIQVNARVLQEVDGPMLVYGLQGFHGETLEVPKKAELRPSEDRLEERFADFRAAM